MQKCMQPYYYIMLYTKFLHYSGYISSIPLYSNSVIESDFFLGGGGGVGRGLGGGVVVVLGRVRQYPRSFSERSYLEDC